MKYKIGLSPKAHKFLKKLDKKEKERIKRKILLLKNNPNLGKPLANSIYFSLRIGDYRALYRIKRKQKLIKILLIAHRKNVYTKFDKLSFLFFY